MSYWLKSIEVTNLGGLVKEYKEFAEGGSLVIGEHGSGKTSLLRALSIFFEGGCDVDLIRKGEPSGEAVITWSDGCRARKRLFRSIGKEGKPGFETEAWGPEGEVKKAPSTWLTERVPKTSFDPFAFLRAEPRERANVLLEHLPLSFTPQEVNAALDAQVGELPNVDFFPHVSDKEISLERLNEIRGTRYSERTNVSVQARDLDAVIGDLQKSLPPESPDITDWTKERDRLQGELTATEKKITGIVESIKLEAEQERSRKRLEIQGKMDALKKELADHLDAVAKAEGESIQDRTMELQQQRSDLSVSLGTAKANADRHIESLGIQRAIAERRKSAEGLVRKEMRLTAVIKALDNLKHERLKQIDIEGFDLSKDSRGRPVVTINGVTLDQLNAQQQLFVAIQCIQFAAGSGRLIITEAADLNDEYMADLAAATKQAGYQLIAARWDKNGTPLTVKAA